MAEVLPCRASESPERRSPQARSGSTQFWRPWVLVALSLMLALGGLGATPTKAFAATDVRVPLPSGISADSPLAVFASNVVIGGYRSTNLGSSWASTPVGNAWRYTGEGNLAEFWGGAEFVVYSVTTGASTVYNVPTNLGYVSISMNSSWVIFYDGTTYRRVNVATGATDTLIQPVLAGVNHSSPEVTPSGDIVWLGSTDAGNDVAAVASPATVTPGAWVTLGPEREVGIPYITGTQLRYSVANSSGAKACYRTLPALSAPSCTTLVGGDQSQVDVTQYGYGATSVFQLWSPTGTADAYLWIGTAAAKIQLPAGSMVDMPYSGNSAYGDTPYVLVRDADSTPTCRRVNADGTLGTNIPLPSATNLSVSSVGVAPDRVVGRDIRDGALWTSAKAWSRPVSGSGFGAEAAFPKRASWLGISAGRNLNLTPDGLAVYDRGVPGAVLPISNNISPGSVSGPFLTTSGLQQVPDGLWPTVSTAFDVTGAQRASFKGDHLLFGSRMVGLTYDAAATGSAHLTVIDLAGGATPVSYTLPAGTAPCQATGLWGETVGLVCSMGSRLEVYNYTTNALLGSWEANSLSPLTIGDGYVVVDTGWNGIGYDAILWNLATGAKTVLDANVTTPAASDGVGHVAYATTTELVWRDFSSLSTSAPRVLGWLVPSSFDVSSGSLAIEVDATKALSAGSLVIKNGAGTTIRTLATPASADGSLRLSWDGKSDGGALVPSGTYTYALVANGADGSGAVRAVDGTSAAAGSVTVGNNAPGAFVSVTPARIMDTRFGVGGFTGPVGSNQSVALQVAGQGGVPASGASAVVLNVTVVAPSKAGNITVYPSDVAVPTASNLNFVPGQTVPNLVTVKLGADGKVKLANQSAGGTYLMADVAGYYAAGVASDPGAFVPVTPSRLLDTRFGPGPVGAVAPQGSVTLKVTGAGGVPASGVGAVVLNVTETAPTQPGNITVYPTDVSVPTASNLNFVAGDTRPNLVTVKVSADGNVTLANQSAGSTHLIVDVAGYYLAGAATLPGMFVPVTPTRLLDTRFGPGPVGAVAAQASIALQITGNSPVPSSGVGAVVLNVTETAPSQAGNITVYPSDVSVPTASNLNFVTGDTYPNLTITKVGGTDGKVKLANQSAGTTYLLADVAGYFLK